MENVLLYYPGGVVHNGVGWYIGGHWIGLDMRMLCRQGVSALHEALRQRLVCRWKQCTGIGGGFGQDLH